MKFSMSMVCALAFIAFVSQQASAQPAGMPGGDKTVAEKSSPDSDTMERADGDMKKVLEALQGLGGKPIETLTAEEARMQPTPADAVKAVLRENGKDPVEENAKLKVTSKNLTYGGGLPVRIYTPDDKSDTETLPIIVFYHGGGWVIADIDVYDATPRSLAKKARAIVVAPEYRLGPENKFPAAHQDAFTAYQWTIQNAAAWGGDANRVAVAGESAGGNLAANVAIMARDQGSQMPVHMLLVYPVAGTDMMTESYQKNANAKPLNKAMMQWFVKNAMTDQDLKDPRIDLIHANLRGLPPATIVTADIDPLMSDGKMLADQLKAADVDTSHRNYEGMTHEFFGMAAVVENADDAQDYAVNRLEDSFKNAKKALKKAAR